MPAIHRLFAGHAHPNPSTDEPLGHWLHSSPIGSKKYPAVEHSELASTELTPLVQSPTTCAFVDGERGGGRCQRWDVGFEGDTREASRRIVHGRADEGRHIVGKVAVKRLQTAGLTSRAWRRGARRTVIWVLVCATAGAAPHSSATATSAIAIRLSMLTMEQSRASTLGGARNKLRSQRRSWAPTL